MTSTGFMTGLGAETLQPYSSGLVEEVQPLPNLEAFSWTAFSIMLRLRPSREDLLARFPPAALRWKN